MDYVKRSVSLPADLNQLLSNEPNASGLITKLARDHYAGKKALADLLNNPNEDVLEKLDNLAERLDGLKDFVQRATGQSW